VGGGAAGVSEALGVTFPSPSSSSSEASSSHESRSSSFLLIFEEPPLSLLEDNERSDKEERMVAKGGQSKLATQRLFIQVTFGFRHTE
jgi:hypothetical protein